MKKIHITVKKFFSLLTVLLLSTLFTIGRGEIITKEVAKQTADNFLSLDSEWHGADEANVQLIEHEGIPAYYIIKYTAGGWAIVAAQSSSAPIIGYNTIGEFGTPATMSALLDFNAKIITARAKETNKIEHKGWQRIKQRKAVSEGHIHTTPDVEPLITVNLNQTIPFNLYCPTVDGFSCVTGCVAVAMAQAMMVQSYPPRPIGSNTYTSTNAGIISVDYDAQPAYDWEAMYNWETTGNYNDLARLLYHAGTSINMQYGLIDGSGANTELVADALINHFCYDKKTIYYTSKCPDNDEWLEQILHELSHGRAVIYGGVSEKVGHCWNIDGWKQSTQMLHCNWGWSGLGNGYFSLDNMTDSYQDISFIYDHNAIFGVVAPSVAPYDIILNNTQFTLDTEAGATLSYIEILSTDKTATYNYELNGPDNTQSPYQIVENNLISTETVTDSDKFKYLRIKATNSITGECIEKEFYFKFVPASTHKLLGTYHAHAKSKFEGYPDQEWYVTITADRYDPNKVWLRPMCMFSGLQAESIYATYAIYDEANNTLTMPLGQVLYEKSTHKMVIGVTYDERSIETTGNITLPITQSNDSTVISFANDYVLGVGNIINNKWWYQALYNITFSKSATPESAPYEIELSNTTYAIGTAADSKLSDIFVSCHDRTATFACEVYDQQGAPSPYKVVNNKLVSGETITDNEKFKHLRIKATNTLTGDWYEKEFEITIIENMSAMVVGTYYAHAERAIAGDTVDEEWEVTITADETEANKVWIHPIMLFADFKAKDIKPVYAIYDATNSTLNLPLGQIIKEQQNYYQFIIGATNNTIDIETSGNIELQVEQDNNRVEIVFDRNYIIGVGNALDNTWWYQALRKVTYTYRKTPEIEVDGIYYNIINEDQKCVEVTYKGNSYSEYKNEYSGNVTIPSTISLDGTIYTVTSIDKYAFAHCDALTYIGIPESVVTIEDYAFADCVGLKTINVKTTSAPVIYENTFDDVERSTPIYVPDGCIEAYQNAQYWNEFTNFNANTGIAYNVADKNIKVTVDNGRITISGINSNALVNIYSANGVLLHKTTVEQIPNIRMTHGIYLVEVNNITEKVIL